VTDNSLTAPSHWLCTGRCVWGGTAWRRSRDTPSSGMTSGPSTPSDRVSACVCVCSVIHFVCGHAFQCAPLRVSLSVCVFVSAYVTQLPIFLIIHDILQFIPMYGAMKHKPPLLFLVYQQKCSGTVVWSADLGSGISCSPCHLIYCDLKGKTDPKSALLLLIHTVIRRHSSSVTELLLISH
jgi:hypothetical protein